MPSRSQLTIVSTEVNAVPAIHLEQLGEGDTFVPFIIDGDFDPKESLIPTKPEDIPVQKHIPPPCVIC